MTEEDSAETRFTSGYPTIERLELELITGFGLSQREATTPSPVSKEDGSNKRVLVNQGNPSRKPQQPPPIMESTVNTPNVAMEITLTTSGQDGNESINSNPNNNPKP